VCRDARAGRSASAGHRGRRRAAPGGRSRRSAWAELVAAVEGRTRSAPCAGHRGDRLVPRDHLQDPRHAGGIDDGAGDERRRRWRRPSGSGGRSGEEHVIERGGSQRPVCDSRVPDVAGLATLGGTWLSGAQRPAVISRRSLHLLVEGQLTVALNRHEPLAHRRPEDQDHSMTTTPRTSTCETCSWHASGPTSWTEGDAHHADR